MGFLVFLFFLYLFFQSIISLLFYLYLWQIKEYRTDRFVCHLRTKTGIKQLLFYLNILQWKGVRRPVFTFKALLIFLFALSFEFRAWLFFFKYLPFDLSFRALATTFLVNASSPFLVSITVFFFQPISFVLKKIIIFLAKRKITLMPDLLVIGVTGSFGKSSTKEILATLLSEKFKVLKTPKNWNTEIGVAKTILRFLTTSHQVFVVEMAAYKRGEIRAICQIVRPKMGIITGVNEQHLALFGSLKETVKAKFELVEALPQDGLAIFNGDNSYCRQMAKKTKIQKKLYSLKEIKNIKIGKKTVSFELEGNSFRLNLLGGFNIANFLAAFHLAKELGLEADLIAKTVKKITPFEGTMKPFLGLNQAFFIDDTYSSNPEGFMAAIDYLEKQRGRKIVVTPGMIELGQAAPRIHLKVARKLNLVADLVILTKKEFAKEMKSEIKNLVVEEGSHNVLKILGKEVGKNDIVLLEGRLPKKIKNQILNIKN